MQMGSREKGQTSPRHPLLSSLVVRPADSGGRADGGVGGRADDDEPGEVRNFPISVYSHSATDVGW